MPRRPLTIHHLRLNAPPTLVQPTQDAEVQTFKNSYEINRSVCLNDESEIPLIPDIKSPSQMKRPRAKGKGKGKRPAEGQPQEALARPKCHRKPTTKGNSFNFMQDEAEEEGFEFEDEVGEE